MQLEPPNKALTQARPVAGLSVPVGVPPATVGVLCFIQPVVSPDGLVKFAAEVEGYSAFDVVPGVGGAVLVIGDGSRVKLVLSNEGCCPVD